MKLLGSRSIRDAFAELLAEQRDRSGVRLLAYVIMPEHVHLVVMPRNESPSIVPFLRDLKRSFAQQAIARWKKLDAPVLHSILDDDGRHRVWQRGGGYDRNLFGDNELHEKINYIHNNPVTRKLATSPLDWAWSSARWYSKRRADSLIPIDSI